ncbi:unnamed protein product [Arabidopsis halleri]
MSKESSRSCSILSSLSCINNRRNKHARNSWLVYL